jgi:hypothetical protein
LKTGNEVVAVIDMLPETLAVGTAMEVTVTVTEGMIDTLETTEMTDMLQEMTEAVEMVTENVVVTVTVNLAASIVAMKVISVETVTVQENLRVVTAVEKKDTSLGTAKNAVKVVEAVVVTDLVVLSKLVTADTAKVILY